MKKLTLFILGIALSILNAPSVLAEEKAPYEIPKFLKGAGIMTLF